MIFDRKKKQSKKQAERDARDAQFAACFAAELRRAR